MSEVKIIHTGDLHLGMTFKSLGSKSKLHRRDCQDVFSNIIDLCIKEKVNAYLSRLFIRDLYDVYILLNYAEPKTDTKNVLRKLLSEFKVPINEDILPSLVFIGAVPTTNQMLQAIKKWAR